MGNPVVYFEIAGPDGQRLRDFYGAAFGWTFDTARVPGYGYVGGAVEVAQALAVRTGDLEIDDGIAHGALLRRAGREPRRSRPP